MEYVMNDTEKKLFEMVEQDGCRAPVQAAIRALIEFGHNRSDMGLREQAQKAFTAAHLLKEMVESIEE